MGREEGCRVAFFLPGPTGLRCCCARLSVGISVEWRVQDRGIAGGGNAGLVRDSEDEREETTRKERTRVAEDGS